MKDSIDLFEEHLHIIPGGVAIWLQMVQHLLGRNNTVQQLITIKCSGSGSGSGRRCRCRHCRRPSSSSSLSSSSSSSSS